MLLRAKEKKGNKIKFHVLEKEIKEMERNKIKFHVLEQERKERKDVNFIYTPLFIC